MLRFVGDLIGFVLRKVTRLLFKGVEQVKTRRPLHLLKPLYWYQRR
jgi:hypothetical protein